MRFLLPSVEYLGHVISSEGISPLHKLLNKQSLWNWKKEQKEAFTKAKGLLTSPKLLVHFDPKRDLLITCDASPYGVGAVLSHSWEDGSGKPIYYASRSLAAA